MMAYLIRLETSPESLQTPPGIFSSRIKYESVRQVQEPIDTDRFMTMLKKQWAGFPDALAISDAAKLTDYYQTTISEWIFKEKLFGVWYHNKYLIPKDCLIEYMVTKAHRITRKSNKHTNLIRKYQEEQPSPQNQKK